MTGMDTFSDRACQFQIITGFRAVAVHTGKQDLTCSEAFHFHRPLYCIDAHIDASAVLVYIPTRTVCSFLGVDRYNDTLASKLISRITDQFRRINRRRID